jgi:hypothetical protein
VELDLVYLRNSKQCGGSMQHIDMSEDLPKEQRTPIHPAWMAFIKYCERLKHGEIARLKVQDGLPVLAEVTTQKVKFS